MDYNIFDNLANYLKNSETDMTVLNFNEIARISGNDFKEKILDVKLFNDYVKLFHEKMKEINYDWTNDFNNNLIYFKKKL